MAYILEESVCTGGMLPAGSTDGRRPTILMRCVRPAVPYWRLSYLVYTWARFHKNRDAACTACQIPLSET